MLTHQPVAASDTARLPTSEGRSAKLEHLEVALLDDRKDLQPILVLRPPVRSFPVVLALENAFFGPRCTQKGQLLVRSGGIARDAVGIVLLLLSNDGLRQVACET